MSNDIEKWVRPEIRAMSAYHVPPAEGLIKLDAMENPYTLPDDLRQQWLEQLAGAELNRYPDPGCGKLKAAIRQVMDVPPECEIILGNGSDELIQMVTMLVGGPGRTLAAPSPSFSMYQLIAAIASTKYTALTLEEDFSADAGKFIRAIEQSSPACVFLAYPNNPTGNSFDPVLIEKVIDAAPGLVIVDEAYHAFSGKSFLHLVPQHPNLLVMRTLSKSGLAGLRLGMMMGSPDWIEQLEKIRLPYNINSLTQTSAEFCLRHYATLQSQADQIVADRQLLLESLQSRSGLTAFPSDANFILVRFDRKLNAPDIHQQLVAQKVLVKNLHKPDDALENCLRITVGTGEQNKLFLSALDHCLVNC